MLRLSISQSGPSSGTFLCEGVRIRWSSVCAPASGRGGMDRKPCIPFVLAVLLFTAIFFYSPSNPLPIQLQLTTPKSVPALRSPSAPDVDRSVTEVAGEPSKPKQLKAKTILVTGALGCIGPGVVQQLLAAHYDVTVLDLSGELEVLGDAASRVRFIQGDIRDEEVLEEVMPTVSGVVNLAAMSRVSWCSVWPVECMDINVRGTQAILRVMSAQRRPPWLLQASSREVFGGITEMPVTEATPHKVHFLSSLPRCHLGPPRPSPRP